MAATASAYRVERDFPHLVHYIDLSSIVSDQQEDLSHGGPTGIAPSYITFEIRTPSDPVGHVTCMRDYANDSTSSDTVRVKIVADETSSLVVRVWFHFEHCASGGIS